MKRKRLKKIAHSNVPESWPIHKLEDLVHIRSGYSFRKKVEHEEDGNIFAIQARDLDKRYTSIEGDSYKVKLKNNPRHHLLNSGEILFLAKGTNNYAMVFNEDLAKRYTPAIATAVFFVLSVKSNIVVPEYLAWYINQAPAQRFFESTLEGSSQQNVRKDSLVNLTLALPPLKQQQVIATIYRLSIVEEKLQAILKTKREQVLKTTLLNSIGL